MSDHRLAIAEWLLDHGAGASARNVLGTLRGAPANRLRLRAAGAALRPGLYALVALPEGVGAVVPLRPSPGRSRSPDPAFRLACDRALDEARAFLRAPGLPALRFAFEEWLTVFGPSIGLPAALAFAAHYASAHAPLHAIVATGEILEGGRVERVGHMAEKLAVAAAEGEVGRILIPAAEPEGRGADRVATVAEALSILPGGRVAPDARHLHVDAVIRRVHADRDHARGIDLLEALPIPALAPADRARVLLELGSLHRYLGHSREAAAIHDEAHPLLASERAVIGAEAAERYELEIWSTALDDFRVEEAEAALSTRLAQPFLKLRNELRCRGMLAQAVGMTGRFAEAARIRAGNLPLHARSDALRKVAPATHGPLALDAARAGDAETFTAQIRAMIDATSPGDDTQERFNASALIRGLAALGRHEEALAWVRDEARIFAARVPSPLARLYRGHGPVEADPELRTWRALCRSLRRAGQPREAMAQADRALFQETAGALAGFFALLVGLEGALALEELGDHEGAAERLRAAREALARVHPGAIRHHADLLQGSSAALEEAIDRVWY